jgi:hypothetical protein
MFLIGKVDTSSMIPVVVMPMALVDTGLVPWHRPVLFDSQ